MNFTNFCGPALLQDSGSENVPVSMYVLGETDDRPLLGEEESGDLGELSDGGRVGVGDHVAEFVERVVQVVHPAALAGVNADERARGRKGEG